MQMSLLLAEQEKEQQCLRLVSLQNLTHVQHTVVLPERLMNILTMMFFRNWRKQGGN